MSLEPEGSTLTVPRIPEETRNSPIFAGSDERIQPYNFYHQETIERIRLRPFEPVLENTAHRIANSLSSILRTPVTIEAADSEQMSWEEYVGGIPDPTFVTSAMTYPVEGRMLVHVPVSLALMILDCYLGGDGFDQPERDQLTDIERVFIAPILEDIWSSISKGLGGLVDLRFGLIQHAQSALNLPIGRASDMCWIINLQIQVGDNPPQTLQFLMAVSWLLPSVEQIEAEQASGVVDERPDNHDAENRLLAVPVETRLCYPPIYLTTSEILSLRPGDVVTVREGTAEETAVLNLVTGELHLGTGILVERGNKLACTVVTKSEVSA